MNAKRMEQLEEMTIERIAGTTNHISDRHRCLAALAYARQRGFSHAKAMGIILAKKRRWLDWLSVTQRRWQTGTRNPNKAHSDDCISLRAKYVRCHV